MATQTPEGWIKQIVKDVLKHGGTKVYYHMPVINGMGRPSLDFIGCVRGEFWGIEAKRPGKDATTRQKQTMFEIVQAGGKVLLVNSWGAINDLVDRVVQCSVSPTDWTKYQRWFANADQSEA